MSSKTNESCEMAEGAGILLLFAPLSKRPVLVWNACLHKTNKDNACFQVFCSRLLSLTHKRII